MIESKSRFARRIGKSIEWVCAYCRRGVIPTNDRGYVFVEEATRALMHRRRRGRPKVEHDDAIVLVPVFVRRRQKKVIIEVAKELRGNS